MPAGSDYLTEGIEWVDTAEVTGAGRLVVLLTVIYSDLPANPGSRGQRAARVCVIILAKIARLVVSGGSTVGPRRNSPQIVPRPPNLAVLLTLANRFSEN